MPEKKDWLRGPRGEQLAMAKNWVLVIPAKAKEWAMPEKLADELAQAAKDAEEALATAQNEDTRTPVATAKCKAAFEVMVALMRDIKRRWFLSPPLTDADMVSLGLKPRDTVPTTSAAPTAQVKAEVFLAGPRELGIRILYVAGNSADAANKGFRVYHQVLEAGESPPPNPKKMYESFFTKRKKDVIPFDYEDSGKRVVIAIQIENNGKKGPWGPMTLAYIP